MDLKKAKVLITGGSTGIGLETARMLVEKGAQVVICARSKKGIEKAAKDTGAIGLQADVSQEDQVTELVKTAIDRMDGLNVLINNAGIGHFSLLTETSVEDMNRVWDTNVKGAFMVGREVAKHFIKHNEGNIINISSTAGSKGFAGGSVYCSSKFALHALTECWRAELRKYNVRVMQVNPSEVITEFANKLGRTQQENDSKLKPKEIAHAITSMLEMDNVGFITEATVWATNPQ